MSSIGTIGTRELVAVAKLASTDETRKPLMCLRFEADGQQMLAIATDARRIGVLRLKADVPHGSAPFAVNIPSAQFAAALSACLDLVIGRHITTVHVDTSAVRILSDGLSVEIPAARVTYPEWRKVFEVARGKCEYTGFNAKLADGFAACDPDGMFATTYGDVGQIFFHGQSGNFFGVLMPVNCGGAGSVRLDGGTLKHAVPSWIGGAK